MELKIKKGSTLSKTLEEASSIAKSCVDKDSWRFPLSPGFPKDSFPSFPKRDLPDINRTTVTTDLSTLFSEKHKKTVEEVKEDYEKLKKIEKEASKMKRQDLEEYWVKKNFED